MAAIQTPAFRPPAAADRMTVDTPTVACDGGAGFAGNPDDGAGRGDGGLGHPLVFLSFGAAREIVCPYCSRTYVLAEGSKAGHGH